MSMWNHIRSYGAHQTLPSVLIVSLDYTFLKDDKLFWSAYPHFCCLSILVCVDFTGWLGSLMVQIAVAMLSGNSLRQTVHTHCASVHQAAKFVAALLMVAVVTAGLVESKGSLPLGLWLTLPAGWLPRTEISSRALRSEIEYGPLLPLLFRLH